MKPELRRLGDSQSPVVVIDQFSGSLKRICEIAEALAPFGAANNYYPGLRRIIAPTDDQAEAYARETCDGAAQFIAGAFDFDRFHLIEASFSMVTTLPERLTGPQRAPHFDSTDQNYLALLHYLRVPPGSGTAFYRQRATGIERVTESNLDLFVRTARQDAAMLARDSGYIDGSDQYFEQIGAIDAIPDRLIIYQGSLLHSGVIPPDMAFSGDPRQGRLTANLFVRGD